jgi:hypothetical protein
VTITPRLPRLALAAAIAASTAVLLGASSRVGPAGPLCAGAASQRHATILVEHASGSVRTACVGFVGAQISAKQLLAASGIPYGLSPDPTQGDAVCSVDSEPTTYPPSCFSLPRYWSLWRAGYGQPWAYATKGIGLVSLGDGDALGFRYVRQDSPAAPILPQGVCPPPQPPVITPSAPGALASSGGAAGPPPVSAAGGAAAGGGGASATGDSTGAAGLGAAPATADTTARPDGLQDSHVGNRPAGATVQALSPATAMAAKLAHFVRGVLGLEGRLAAVIAALAMMALAAYRLAINRKGP